MSTEALSDSKHLFIPQRLAVKSMRDNGYKNTAYALAELIDNSYQAIERVQELNSEHVGEIEVIVVEEWENLGQRNRQRPKLIGVVDNGSGMTAAELRNALQFGNGSHLNDRKGIGRFGMGLPNSTVSQCRRADVWSWKTGPVNAVHSYLDLELIENDQLEEVPMPTAEPVPQEWLQYAPMIQNAESGTLVVWSELDRVMWRTAKSTVDNTEALVGRIYRKLIAKGLLLSLTIVSDGVPKSSRVRPNDPLYLTLESSTPHPFDKTPMFQPYGATGKQVFPIDFRGERHEVVITLSYAKNEARLLPDGGNPGAEPWGKHARGNIGVSIVRADRELVLDTAWTNNDLRERWWGAEVSFPPGLDEVFGVTNNKQYATHFTEMADYYLDTQNDHEWQEIREVWEEEDDPQRHLVDICNYLNKQIDRMRVLLKEQTKGIRTPKQQRHDFEVETKATQASRERADAGKDAGVADANPDPVVKKKSIEENLIAKKYEEESAREIAEMVVSNDLKVLFVQQENAESQSFFHVDVIPGVTEVVFNTAHPVYQMLISTLDPTSDNETPDQLRRRIDDASSTLKLLLAAWARYEAEEKAGERQESLRETRQDWGRMAKAFLKDFQVHSTSHEEALG